MAELFIRGPETEGMTPPKSKAKNKAKIVVGTVEGDLHDIGKDIFICMLEASGFKVMTWCA